MHAHEVGLLADAIDSAAEQRVIESVSPQLRRSIREGIAERLDDLCEHARASSSLILRRLASCSSCASPMLWNAHSPPIDIAERRTAPGRSA